ncbi:hypothetical protein L1887_01168 [Cichorium endivia]|nr:hypothetical protein L1887_01168 [Cichorium endivia]
MIIGYPLQSMRNDCHLKICACLTRLKRCQLKNPSLSIFSLVNFCDLHASHSQSLPAVPLYINTYMESPRDTFKPRKVPLLSKDYLQRPSKPTASCRFSIIPTNLLLLLTSIHHTHLRISFK